MSKITILIDESGTLPDTKDRVVVIAAVGTDVPKTLLGVTKRVRETIRVDKKEKQMPEVKFYRAGERTKSLYLKELAKKNIDIFVLVVDKKDQKISDTPEHFAWLCYILLEECLLFYKQEIQKVIFDKHFHRQKDLENFDNILEKLLARKIETEHVDSIQSPEVNVADMVAGSLLWHYTGKDEKFYNLIKDKIISEKILNWRDARQRFFSKTKNSPNRCKHPSKGELNQL